MSNGTQCDFLVMRYVPDAFRNEFVNIGVLLLGREHEYADVRFTRDWARVQCIDPQADTELLQALEDDIRTQLRGDKESVRRFVYRLQDTMSSALQLSEPNAMLSDAPAKDLERLATTYLERPRPKRESKIGGRQRIFQQMQRAFEGAGVWQALHKKIAVAEYTNAGDPLRIDCGYQPNGVVRLFHAVSLATDPDAAKVLAFSYPPLSAGIRRMRNASSDLTAIVEDSLDNQDQGIQFALETFRQSSINVATVSSMPAIAERARSELRL